MRRTSRWVIVLGMITASIQIILQLRHLSVPGGTWINATFLVLAVILLIGFPLGYFIEQRKARKDDDTGPLDPNGASQD